MKHLLIILLLSSCSATWHLQQAIAKDPSILLEPKTITLIDTVYSNSIRVDTLAHFIRDTFTIEKDRLMVQIKRIHDTLIISAECRADTVEVIREVQLPAQIKYIEKPRWQMILRWVLFAGFVLFLMRNFIKQLLGIKESKED